MLRLGPVLNVPFDPSAWLASASTGHCGVTTSAGVCSKDQRGAFQLSPTEFSNWTSAATACIARCSHCERCKAITVSQKLLDCSWYASCDGTSFKPAPGFRSALVPTSSEVRPPIPHNLRANLDVCESAPSPTFGTWRSAINEHLTDDDRAMFERVTGGTVAKLLHALHTEMESNEAATMSRLMGNDKFVPHALNAKGVISGRLEFPNALPSAQCQRRRRTRAPYSMHLRFSSCAHSSTRCVRCSPNA